MDRRKAPTPRKAWFLRDREKDTRTSNILGVALVLVLHGGAYGLFSLSGFTYMYPPPAEKSLLIDFEEVEKIAPPQNKNGSRPVAETPDKAKPVELVKASQAQHEGTKANQTKEATVGDKGDVEVPEPPREEPIDSRALFSAPKNKNPKDTLAAHTAREASDKLSEGHSQGNMKTGETTGEPNAHVRGRSVIGALPAPSYDAVNVEGTVVVAVRVDQEGRVTSAKAGAAGTTTTEQSLWKAAEAAALKTIFNKSSDSPVSQEGTITYKFVLNRK